MIKKEQIKNSIEKVLEGKGKRNFKQTMELMINFRGLDFKKPENRLNLTINLPHPSDKETKIAVFAEGQMALDAKKKGLKVISQSDIEEYSKNKKSFKTIAKNYKFLAEPKLMVDVGKHLGQVLGPRGKLPKPVTGDLDLAIKQAKSSVKLVTKGKYLPVLHCAIGTEDMDVKDLTDNVEAVYEKILHSGKVLDSNIKSMYLKLTMSKPVKVE